MRGREIKNIIFDLGGVIINLDIPGTISAFNKLVPERFEKLYSQAAQSELFDNFDKGKIGETEFFEGLSKEIGFTGKNEQMLKAWNAMLLDIPARRLKLLQDLKAQYNTYLLSNTNETHIGVFESELYRHHGVKNFADYFDGVYYSCRTGMRKPDSEIFQHVLGIHGLDPAETVFIDDSIQHVKGAGECGINAYLLPKGMEVEELLKQLKLL
jgi:glucose-1-phosphatase